MKLKLKNVRQHKSKEIDIPDKGIVRIKGPSGVGKTTFFDAVRQALYGDVKGLTHWDESSSKIYLEWLGMALLRTNRPNALRLKKGGQDFVDDQADSEIQKLLDMSSEEFMASSYIQQEFADSLLTLTPADQLRLIQRLAFGDDDPEVTKAKIKAIIDEKTMALKLAEKDFALAETRSNELARESNRLKALADVAEPEEPEEIEVLEAYRLAIAGVVNTLKKTILECQRQLSSPAYGLTDQLKTKEAVLANVAATNEPIIFFAKEKLAQLSSDDSLPQLRSKKKELEEGRAYFSLTKAAMEGAAAIEARYSDRDRSKKLMDYLNDRAGKVAHSISSEKQHIKELEADLANVRRAKDALECPECKAALRLVEGKLVPHAHDIVDLGGQEQGLEMAIDTFQETLEQLEADLLQLSSHKTTITNYRDRVMAAKKPSFKSEADLEAELSKVEEQIHRAMNQAKDRQDTLGAIEMATRLIEVAKKDVDSLKLKIASSGQLPAKEAVQSQQEKAQAELDQKSGDLVLLMQRIADREKKAAALQAWRANYSAYEEAFKKASEAAKAHRLALDHLTKLQLQLAGALRLKEISDKAALEAVASVFNSINYNARQYIDAMFPETGTMVQLRNVKELKNGEERSKPSLYIYHKASVASGFKDLSGGEKARIKLAFHLALSDLYQSPILLIDEPFQGLGAEDRQLAFDVLENISHNKLVMIIEHNMEDSQADFIVEA